MNIHAVIYTQPGCSKCQLTENKLRESMSVKVEHLFNGNDTWSDKKLEKFRAEGYQSFPVVRIWSDDTGERLDDWSDFRMDKIQKWKKVADENNSQ